MAKRIFSDVSTLNYCTSANKKCLNMRICIVSTYQRSRQNSQNSGRTKIRLNTHTYTLTCTHTQTNYYNPPPMHYAYALGLKKHKCWSADLGKNFKNKSSKSILTRKAKVKWNSSNPDTFGTHPKWLKEKCPHYSEWVYINVVSYNFILLATSFADIYTH